MHKLIGLTVMGFLCGGLAACNDAPKAPAAPPPVQVVQQPCNCTPEVTERDEHLTRLSHERRSYRRTRAHHPHTADEYLGDGYAQVESSSYSSGSSYSSEESYDDGDDTDDYGTPPPPPRRAHRWVDGYGRTHFYGATAGEAAHYEEDGDAGDDAHYAENAALAAHMSINSGAHKKPWWKYDEDCKDAR